MSSGQPKPVPRKPRVRTTSEPDSHLQHSHDGLEQGFGQMNIGQGNEIQRLSEQVSALKQEEQRLREVVAQLHQQQSALAQGASTQRGSATSEDALKRREAELQQRESAFQRRQMKFESEVSDKEYTLRDREMNLRRMEDEVNVRKKELALARFDEDSEDDVSSAQLAKLADRKMELQKEEERLRQKEYDLNQWAMKLDQQSRDNQQRLIDIQQREANIASYPTASHAHTQLHPHPQWGGQEPRPQIHTSPVLPTTAYQQPGHQQPGLEPLPYGGGYAPPGQQWYSSGSPAPSAGTGYPPYAAGPSATAHSPSPPGPTYNQPHPQHHAHQGRPHPHLQPANQYQSPQVYEQQRPSPHSSPDGPPGGFQTAQVHGGHSSGSGEIGQSHSASGPLLSGTYLNPPMTGGDRSQLAGKVVFSVGSSSTSMASATSGNNGQNVAAGGVAMGGATRQPHAPTQDRSEEVARALEWEEHSQARHQENADLEYARKLQEEFNAEVTQQHGQTADLDEMLALQLQHEDLKEEYGAGLTHINRLSEGDEGEVTEVVKKVLDERMTRQFQIKEQEEADRRIAENISASGDPSLQTNVQNNLSS